MTNQVLSFRLVIMSTNTPIAPPSRSVSQAGGGGAMGNPMLRFSDQEKSLWRDSVPKVVVTGLKKSGKSSILRVLFNKVSPHEACYLEPTMSPSFLPLAANPLLNVRIAEIPGNWSWGEESDQIDELFFGKCHSVIVVIDSSTDEVPHSVFSVAKRVIARAFKISKNIHFHLFLNKVDANYRFDPDSAQSENNKVSFVQQIVGRVRDDVRNLLGNNGSSFQIDLAAHCTSIFDSSINEAFSKVIQRPLLANGKIEQILDIIANSCKMEKAVLFDAVSKLTLGADNRTQTDTSTLSLMQDVLEVVIDMSSIYGTTCGTTTDTKTICDISLANGDVISMRLIEKNLALVSIFKNENFEKTFLLNHNIAAFKDALMRLVALS